MFPIEGSKHLASECLKLWLLTYISPKKFSEVIKPYLLKLLALKMGWYVIRNLQTVDHYSYTNTVPDPGLEIRGWGESSRPLDKGPSKNACVSPAKNFSPLGLCLVEN